MQTLLFAYTHQALSDATQSSQLRLWPFLTHVGSNEAQLPPLSYPRPPMLRPPPLPAHSAAAEAPPRVRPFLTRAFTAAQRRSSAQRTHTAPSTRHCSHFSSVLARLQLFVSFLLINFFVIISAATVVFWLLPHTTRLVEVARFLAYAEPKVRAGLWFLVRRTEGTEAEVRVRKLY